MRKIFVLLLILTQVSCSNESNSSDNSCVYEGNLTLKTQEEINDFANNNYCRINGDLLIGSTSALNQTNINSLAGLETLNSIKGDLTIINNPNLSNLIGIQNINEIGNSLIIRFNNNLERINELSNITTIAYGLYILYNESLIDIKGLENINILENIQVIGNAS